MFKYGYPFSERSLKSAVAKRIDVLIGAFSNLTADDDKQNNAATYAPALVSSFSMLLRTSVPANIGMIGYACIREWRAAIGNKSYVETVVGQLETFDSEFAKYQLAFGDAPLKMEENETVTTSPNVEGQLGSSGVKSKDSTPAGTGKHDNESALSDGDTDNGKKKAKKTISRQITLPQASKK
jgi:hypothetical protein